MTQHQLRSFAVAVALAGALSAELVCAQAAPQQPAPAPAPAPTQTAAPPAVAKPPVAQPPVTKPSVTPPQAKPATPAAPRPDGTTQEMALPSGYVIGPDDVLSIIFWRDKDMSAEVAVRPDGVISLPLLNEIAASGLTPEQLRGKIAAASMKFMEEEPTVSVVVKTINSRKVYITGGIAKAGFYNLSGPTTVVQLIAMAGGIAEFSNSKNILIVRVVGGKQTSFKFNYKTFAKGQNLKQNIELLPGDSVIVP